MLSSNQDLPSMGDYERCEAVLANRRQSSTRSFWWKEEEGTSDGVAGFLSSRAQSFHRKLGKEGKGSCCRHRLSSGKLPPKAWKRRTRKLAAHADAGEGEEDGVGNGTRESGRRAGDRRRGSFSWKLAAHAEPQEREREKAAEREREGGREQEKGRRSEVGKMARRSRKGTEIGEGTERESGGREGSRGVGGGEASCEACCRRRHRRGSVSRREGDSKSGRAGGARFPARFGVGDADSRRG